jgi:hypothetical protein
MLNESRNERGHLGKSAIATLLPPITFAAPKPLAFNTATILPSNARKSAAKRAVKREESVEEHQDQVRRRQARRAYELWEADKKKEAANEYIRQQAGRDHRASKEDQEAIAQGAKEAGEREAQVQGDSLEGMGKSKSMAFLGMMAKAVYGDILLFICDQFRSRSDHTCIAGVEATAMRVIQ